MPASFSTSAPVAARSCVLSPGFVACSAPTGRFRVHQSSRRARRDKSSQARARWKPEEIQRKENEVWPKVIGERLRFLLPVARRVTERWNWSIALLARATLSKFNAY